MSAPSKAVWSRSTGCLSLRLVNEVYTVLMRGVRGAEKRPGELRTTQNWIEAPGAPITEARYVPPPAASLLDVLYDLESFVNNDFEMPPLLYCSAYFERARDEYYGQLLRDSAPGDSQTWIRYFLDGVLEQARDALVHSRKVRDLQQQYRCLLQHRHVSGNALCLLDELFGNPYVTGPSAAGLLDVTDAGARRILERLKEAGIVEEWPGT